MGARVGDDVGTEVGGRVGDDVGAGVVAPLPNFRPRTTAATIEPIVRRHTPYFSILVSPPH